MDFVNDTTSYRDRGPRRYLRDHSDPFSKYCDQEFHARYGFTPEAVKNKILPLVESDLRKPTKRGLPFAPEIMLLITLRYFATGSFQKLDGDVMNICQQSGSRIIAQVSTVIATKMRDFVQFPITAEGIKTLKEKFYEIASFPGVIGCIGCTHIKIKNPGGSTAEVYKNRNGYFSINVQAVTGPNLYFFDLVARWPGSTHDSLIFNSSALKQRLLNGELQGIILGDSRYEVSDVLLTPFLSPNSTPQEQYNRSLIRTRNTIERCFDVWKRRFPCLQVGMNIKLETVLAVICACATLHNMAVLLDDLIPSNWVDEESIPDVVDVPDVGENPNSNGFLIRESLAERFFS